MAMSEDKAKHSTDGAKLTSLMCNDVFFLYSVFLQQYIQALDFPLIVKGCVAISVFLISQPYSVV